MYSYSRWSLSKTVKKTIQYRFQCMSLQLNKSINLTLSGMFYHLFVFAKDIYFYLVPAQAPTVAGPNSLLVETNGHWPVSGPYAFVNTHIAISRLVRSRMCHIWEKCQKWHFWCIYIIFAYEWIPPAATKISL